MEEKKKEWRDKPLGLPSGSVRAIIALGLVAVIIGFYFGKSKD